mgnify:CR=1 FL=1
MPGAHTLARINTRLDLLMPILYSYVATSYGAMHCAGACANPDDIFSVALTPLFETPRHRSFLLPSRDIRRYLPPLTLPNVVLFRVNSLSTRPVRSTVVAVVLRSQ